MAKAVSDADISVRCHACFNYIKYFNSTGFPVDRALRRFSTLPLVLPILNKSLDPC